MKKIISLVLALALMLPLCVGLASCAEDGKTPYIGENGNWWIGDTDLGVSATGPKGEDGKDAEMPYIGENGNWWVGDTDLGVPARGPKGEDGIDGIDGESGKDPYIGENGNWWVGDTDLGVSATGPKGEDGIDGETPYIGENGNWWVGDTDLGVSATGPKGEDGIDGKTPYIAENGNWWIGDTDLGVPATGPNGEDGIDGETPYIGENGNWWVGDTDLGVPATGNGGTTDPDGPSEKPEDENGKLTVQKTSSYKYLRTAHPGDEIVYTFTVTNTTNEAKVFDITDTVPENTTYKSGDATVNGNAITMSVSIPTGETKTLSYTVQVVNDLARCGEKIDASAAQYLGNSISCEDIYIASTFNENDMEKLSLATVALRNSEFTGKDLLKSYFLIAFGLSNAIAEDADAVANALFINSTLENSDKYAGIVIPGLYGGNKISSAHSERFKGTATNEIFAEDVFPGDVIIVLPSASDLTGAKFYVTDGNAFYDVTGKMTETVTDYVLDSIAVSDYFAVLRPVSASKSVSYFRTQPLYEGQTDVEKAIIAAANAFILRGDRMQYDDKYMATSVPRYERNKTPEDYTSDEIGYSDCTSFIHDVYYTALGWDYGNHALYNSSSAWFVYDYYLTNNETEEEIAAIEKAFMAALKPGDIVYYRYSTNNHGMLYIGNGTLAHCTGSVYNYSGPNEVQETAIRYQNVKTLFTPGGSRYLFQDDKPRSRFFILRPTNTWNGQIPEETVSRVQNMQGIVAEKLSSHTLGQTVNPGDLISYSFKIFNSNSYPVTLNVTDVIPEGTSLVVDGNPSSETSLSWNIELQPGEEELISYAVKVDDDAEDGFVITCSPESAVGGVPVRSTNVYVGRTLTEAEQKALVEAVYACINGNLKGSDLVDKIYETAFGIEDVFGASISDVRAALFLGDSQKTLADEGKFAEMVAPTLYGGKNVANSTRFLGERTRMPWERNLIVGDILFFATSSRFYMYVGNGEFIDMETFKVRDAFERLEETIGWQEFAILRPSLTFDN